MTATAAPTPGAGDVLAPTRGLRTVAAVFAGVCAVTVAAALAAALFPSLGPGQDPRPTLHGRPGEVLSIVANNMRVFGGPLVLVATGWTVGRTRLLGDLVLAAIAAGNVVVVGLALGRHRGELMPYLPHLPIEWAAFSVALACWIAHRGSRPGPRVVLPYAAAVLLLALGAAAVEVYAVPHR